MSAHPHLFNWGGCRVQRSVAAAARAAQKAAVDRLSALNGYNFDWTNHLVNDCCVLDPDPDMDESWVSKAVQEVERVVCMLTAAAASATVAPASGLLLAAAAGEAGGSVQRSPGPHLQAQRGPKPASPVMNVEAAAASQSATKRMMGMLVPVELQPWQSHELKDNDSSYSGATAMRPLREWLTTRANQFGPELVAAIIRRFG